MVLELELELELTFQVQSKNLHGVLHLSESQELYHS